MSIKELIKKVIGYNNVKMDSNYYRELGAVIGDNVKFNSGYPIDMNFPWLITIGNNVTLASNVRLLAHDASTALVEDVHTKLGIVKIGDNVFIGADSVVLCNVRIGDNVVIGANSVVTHDIPSNSVYAGNPAEYICSFDEFSEKHKNNQISHPIFRKYRWYDWPNASAEEKEQMRKELEDKFGYL